MLTLLIPGPQQHGNNIDVYLEPLIEDLNHLWNDGELTYVAFSKTTFTLKVMLLWTISDFPAYENLPGCKVKGKICCPLCGKNKDSMWLKNCRKHVYMCHRKGLPPAHRYRGKKAWFDGKVEYGRKARILTCHNISQILRNYKNVFGKREEHGIKRKRTDYVGSNSDSEDVSSKSEEEEAEVDEEELSRWKKRPIFFQLPYWEELPVRHNLNVMHVERNVCASIVSTLLHCGKSMDVLNTRKDLEILGFLTSKDQMALLSSDPKDFVNNIPLGLNFVKVLVETSLKPDAFLWRPIPIMFTVEEAVGKMIAWPAYNCVILDKEPEQEDIAPKSSGTNSINRCTLMDWDGNEDVVVVEGRWQTRDPKALVNEIPLGPNAIKVFVDEVLQPDTFMWRPTPEMKNIEESLKSFIAWPANKVVFDTTRDASSGQKSPIEKSTTLYPLQRSWRNNQDKVEKENQNCKLMDCTRKKRIVVEGRWSSNNPEHIVHFVPLGPHAVKVWVDVVKVKDAAVWRSSSKIECMDDALGSAIASTEDKVVIC